MRLKKELLKMTSSEASFFSEADSSEANSLQSQIHQKQRFFRHWKALTKYNVQKVQPLCLRLSLQPPTLHSVLYTRQEQQQLKQRLFHIYWNEFEFTFILQSSNQAKDQRCQISFGKEKVMSWLVPNVSQTLYK